MFCTHCGKPNSDNAKFCEFCGKPISAFAEVAGTPRVEVVVSKPTRNRRIASIGASIVLLCFFLPWAMVSCSVSSAFGNRNGMEITGLEIASGNYKFLEQLEGMGSMFGGGDQYQTEEMAVPLLFVVPLLGVAGLFALGGKRSGAVIAIVSGILGVIGMIIFSIFFAQAQTELRSQGFDIEYRFGYWGTWIGFITAVVLGVYTIDEGVKR